MNKNNGRTQTPTTGTPAATAAPTAHAPAPAPRPTFNCGTVNGLPVSEPHWRVRAAYNGPARPVRLVLDSANCTLRAELTDTAAESLLFDLRDGIKALNRMIPCDCSQPARPKFEVYRYGEPCGPEQVEGARAELLPSLECVELHIYGTTKTSRTCAHVRLSQMEAKSLALGLEDALLSHRTEFQW